LSRTNDPKEHSDSGATVPRTSAAEHRQHLRFREAEAIPSMLDQLGICASSGSACNEVRSSLPRPDRDGHSAASRAWEHSFQPGIYNTREELDYCSTAGHVWLRAISPLNHQHPDNDRFDLTLEAGMAR
jgi:cysteine sulfinate desulfinase/cysteine desulfurase-like protein